jgi:hypothetical protein
MLDERLAVVPNRLHLTGALETYRVILGGYPRQGGELCYASDHAAVLAQFDF